MPSIEEKLRKIDELKIKIQQLNSSPNWNEKFFEKIKLDFTFFSNKLENNSLAYGQTLRFLKEAITPKDAPIKDCLDMENHFKVLDSIFTIHNTPVITIDHILHLHKALMKDSNQWDYDSFFSPGQFKIRENFVQTSTGQLKEFIAPGEVKSSVEALLIEVERMNANNEHPLKIATYFHNRFIGEIHPFEDGNGRTGRIVMNEILLKADLTPIFISSEFEKEDRLNYLHVCEKSNSQNLDSMQDYLADMLIRSLENKRKFVVQASIDNTRRNQMGR